MSKPTERYVSAVAVLAILAGGFAFLTLDALPAGALNAIALLSVLALTAELLAFGMANSATGSIAFIPYLAAAITVPTGYTLVAVALVKAVAELTRRNAMKSLFNVAQHVLTFATAMLVYTSAGGTPLIEAPQMSLADATARFGLASLFAFAISFLVNAALVGGVIAISTARPIKTVWRQTLTATVALDILAIPLVFVFAWLYVRFGALAAATSWVPILGLRQVHKVNLDLERTTRELLELMVKSIEARDPYTSGHSRRVQRFATVIARAVGLSEREIESVSRAALLHDVGKIHEKYAPILRKPSKLTPDEWRTMQEHPEDGAALIGTVSGLRPLVAAVRHHHEKWDGTGYPAGLAGEQIPLGARIVMIADTIDAMTSERPYRGALAAEQVRAELIRCRATQFDPQLVDRLLSSPLWPGLFAPVAHAAPSTAEVLPLRRSREAAV